MRRHGFQHSLKQTPPPPLPSPPLSPALPPLQAPEAIRESNGAEMIEAQMEQERLEEEVVVPGRAGWRAGLCPVTGRLTRSGKKLSQGAVEKARMTGARGAWQG